MHSQIKNPEIQTRAENENINISEIFDFIKTKNQEKIKEYFSNPDYKLWLLKDQNGYTILHRAVFNSDTEITELIIKEVKSRLGLGKINSISKFINEKTNEGLTAIHYAANKGNLHIFKLLKENGANVDEVTNLGKNVLHMAAEGNQPSMIIYLIEEEHQSPTSIDENGSSPLHWACYFGAEEAVNFLLYLKANINQCDKENITPLHLAVNEGKENIVLKLLQKNADRNIANNKGELPIDIARKKNNVKIEQILVEDNVNPLFTIQMPMYYIQPKNMYKNIIILMLVIPEVILFLFVLPYLQNPIHDYINIPIFFLSLVSYIIFARKDPGYRKDIELEKQAGGKYPLLSRVNEDLDVRNFCPKCYIQKANNIAHCFECDKCVEEFSHHCFWINKCVGKKNLLFYFIFVLFTLLYANHSLFACIELIIDDVNLPYDRKTLDVRIFNNHRGFRVLGASLVGVFSLFVGLPLWFLFLIEIFKKFGCLKKNKNIIESQLQEIILRTNTKNPDKFISEPTHIEMKEKREYVEDEEDEKEGLLDMIGEDEGLDNNGINDYKNSFGSNPLEDMDDNNNILEDNDNNYKENNNKEKNIIQLVENGEIKQEEEIKDKSFVNNNKEEKKEEEEKEDNINNKENENNNNTEENNEDKQIEVEIKDEEKENDNNEE